jgi:hypothetical protein
MRVTHWATAAVLLGTWAGISWAQAPAPRIDPTPLVRPSPLAVLQTPEPAGVLNRIAVIVRSQGFIVSQLNVADQVIEARRPDPARAKAYDKVLIWLERDFNEPAARVKIFFFYGRYEEILASRRDVYRVEVSSAEEDAHVGTLKQALLSLPGG